MTAEQLELFNSPLTVISLLPCGRGGPCEAAIERGPDGLVLRCVTCNCTAPYRSQKSPTRAPATQTDALSAVFDGFIQSQQSQFEFLREQAIAPGDPGNS